MKLTLYRNPVHTSTNAGNRSKHGLMPGLIKITGASIPAPPPTADFASVLGDLMTAMSSRAGGINGLEGDLPDHKNWNPRTLKPTRSRRIGR